MLTFYVYYAGTNEKGAFRRATMKTNKSMSFWGFLFLLEKKKKKKKKKDRIWYFSLKN